MTIIDQDYQKALDIFKMQMKCVVDDDRKSQMKLYGENLHYEFPFANDRPKLIDGRDSFRQIMEPIWENRRRNKIQLSLGKYEFHATDESELYIAIFELNATMENEINTISSPCVQLIRIHDSLIIEVREYFEP